MSCCPHGSHAGQPGAPGAAGQVVDIGGRHVYRVGSGEKAILLISDIFGFDGGRIRKVADELAHEGYTAICPDFFEQKPWPADKALGPDIMDWIASIKP